MGSTLEVMVMRRAHYVGSTHGVMVVRRAHYVGSTLGVMVVRRAHWGFNTWSDGNEMSTLGDQHLE